MLRIVNVLRIGIARAAAVSCRLALRNETAGIDLTRRLRLSLSDRVSRRHYRQSEDGQQSPSRDACIHFNRPPCLFVMNAGAYRSIKSGKHSRLLVGLDPLIRRQRSVADDGAERDDRRRETQQPNRNRAILTFVFECARRRGPHACLLTASNGFDASRCVHSLAGTPGQLNSCRPRHVAGRAVPRAPDTAADTTARSACWFGATAPNGLPSTWSPKRVSAMPA